MKKRKGLLFAVMFLLIVWADVLLFGASLFAFKWHVRHGFHREVNGIRFRVPLFYQESETSTPNEFSIAALPSPIHRSDASITVSFSARTSATLSAAISEEDAETMGLIFVAQRNAKLGSRPGSCAEYLRNDLNLGGRMSVLGPTAIECRFDDVEARFSGSPNAVPEFYSL